MEAQTETPTLCLIGLLAESRQDTGQRAAGSDRELSISSFDAQPASPAQPSIVLFLRPVAQSAAILPSLQTNGWMGPATRLLHSGPISDASGLLRSTGTYITDYMTLHM